MTREELKAQIDELMRQYADEEIDGATYARKMMELTTSARDESDEELLAKPSLKPNSVLIRAFSTKKLSALFCPKLSSEELPQKMS